MILRKGTCVVLVACVLMAGCASLDAPSAVDEPADDGAAPMHAEEVVVDVAAAAEAAAEGAPRPVFVESVVEPAVGYWQDLYEPTIDVSNTGTIYLAGHTIAADTTGAPAFVSRDDGASWTQLPFLASVSMPGTLPGGSPPPSDEIFIVAGDDGWAFGADITGATYPLTMWRDDGAQMAYHSPNEYNRADASSACQPASAADRPWAAYANGTLLMVNNPAGGVVQLGVKEVPPDVPVGAGAPLVGTQWNNCAAKGTYFPGIPDIRDDGLFAVPHIDGDRLMVVIGNRQDIFDVEVREAFEATTAGSITVAVGQAAFDAVGDLFVGMSNNTYDVEPRVGIQLDDGRVPKSGQFKLAVSRDDGASFAQRTFATQGIVQSLYIDGGITTAGALVVWAVPGDAGGKSDWYVAHAHVGDDGAPSLRNVMLAVDEGPPPSADITGAAVGPDGRAYLAMYTGTQPGPDPRAQVDHWGSTPLSVWIQQEGPVLGDAP